MIRPHLMMAAAAGLGLTVLVILASRLGAAQGQPSRQFFEISTGSSGGTYFPIGEMIAGIVSHPPGLARCDAPAVCGPPGLVVSARTSDGAVANVLAVNSGDADSALAQGNVVADAVAGRGVFRREGRQTHIRVIAGLFPEFIQLVALRSAHIAKVGDLNGKRVSLGNEGSGDEVFARDILSAYGIPLRRIVTRRDSYDASASLLQQGKIDAFFFVGAAPSPLIADLLRRGTAQLVAIDGPGRHRLLMRETSLAADTVPSGTYPGSGPIDTVSCRTLWIVRDSASPNMVYGVVRSLFNPANRALLDAGPQPASRIRLDEATSGLTAPLHPGAARFFRESIGVYDPKQVQRR
jgi:uncharacterized protein